MNPLMKFESPPSLKEMALQALRNALLTNQFQPKKIYRIDEIARSFGVSKTPVREALLDLATQGFLTFLPRRGIQINSLDERDIRDLYRFRIVMETAIIRCIAPTITEVSITQAEAINNASKGCLENDDKIGFLRKDREFHLFFAELTENKYLVSALENIRDLIDWMGAKALLRKERMMEVFVEHDKLIQMLKKRVNEKEAMVLMERHIIITMDNVLNRLASNSKDSHTREYNNGKK